MSWKGSISLVLQTDTSGVDCDILYTPSASSLKNHPGILSFL
jgi:hypothetical protein